MGEKPSRKGGARVEAEGNRAFAEEENIIIDQEIEAINRELEQLRGTPIHRDTYPPVKDKSRDIKEAIGLHKEEPRKPNEPIFLKPSRIKNQKRDLSRVLLSGINMLDKRIIGFNPGELSIWSGSKWIR